MIATPDEFMAFDFGEILIVRADGGELPPHFAQELIQRANTQPSLLNSLREVTNHFAAVMGGPLIRGQGITFEGGVEGIPTIRRARAAIAQADHK